MLLARERVSVVEAVERLAGTQAQEAKPPFVGLWTRLEAFTRKDLHDALHDREVVRATMMRGTLHLTSARDYAALRMRSCSATWRHSGRPRRRTSRRGRVSAYERRSCGTGSWPAHGPWSASATGPRSVWRRSSRSRRPRLPNWPRRA